MPEIAPVEPQENPNPKIVVDPPRWLRFIIRRIADKATNPAKRARRRARAEAQRVKSGAPHCVEYFHQLDDPYSHLTAQVLAKFAARYNIVIKPHLINATGGKNQPRLAELAVWAHRDATLIAPHYGLSFPKDTPETPSPELQTQAANYLAALSPEAFLAEIEAVSTALWTGDEAFFAQHGEPSADGAGARAAGSQRMAALNHYSGATFYYAGEWYWGVDRLFYLEARLQELSANKTGVRDYLVPRPDIDTGGVDASALTLDFYPSLNSPYTSIIFDKTIALKNACNIAFNHKPVLPMIMRGVAATNAKGTYIFFDTKREGEFLGVPFGPIITPIGAPTRAAYALLPWAYEQGKDEALMSSLLRAAWSENIALHKNSGMARAVKRAGLDWNEARKQLKRDDWKQLIAEHQHEMVEGMGLWGVPSYRLSGPDGEPDLEVWGQDRLWLVAAEIKRRAGKSKAK
jgi:2-hydroxychromene-2-carboxylate isomerase